METSKRGTQSSPRRLSSPAARHALVMCQTATEMKAMGGRSAVDSSGLPSDVRSAGTWHQSTLFDFA